MSLNIGDNFKYLGKKFLDDRESFATLKAMKECESVPDGFITYCKENGKRYEFKSSNTIDELTGRWIEFFINNSSDDSEEIKAEFEDFKQEINEKIDEAIDNIEPEDCYYLGTDEPENDKIWFFNSRQSESPDLSYDNPIIAELFDCIQALQSQITTLQAEVEYLKINGGGGIPVEPDGSVGIFLMLEDGGFFELESGVRLLLEEDVVITKEATLLLEDGGNLLLEDGGMLILE
jgi:hypothetical protein